MNINFTNREYEALLDMIYLADWMLHAHDTEKSDDIYQALEQKILGYAKDFGCGDKIVFDPKLQQHFPTRAYEESEEIQGVIDDYDNETFWDELSDRLATRDLVRQHGAERLDSMTPKDRIHAFCEAESLYADEFETNGLDRVEIRKAQQ